MKVVDLGNSAVAIELDEKADRIAGVDLDKLKEYMGGQADEAISILRSYLDKLTSKSEPLAVQDRQGPNADDAG